MAGDSGEVIIDEDGQLRLYSTAWSDTESDLFYENLHDQTPWQQPEIHIAGKRIKIPRLQAWYGDSGACYRYSGLLMEPLIWTDTLVEVKKRVEQLCSCRFNSALVNFYRDGNDSVGWHSDDEPELGCNPSIASVSLGATRGFQIQHKADKHRKLTIDLVHGDLVLMQGEFQHHWRHQLPKTRKLVAGRINITFRWINVTK